MSLFHEPEGFDAAPLRLGSVAVQAGLITPEQLDDALALQAREGGRIGRHLILMGVVSRYDLYACVADQFGLPFVNLMTDPPDPALMASIDPKSHVDREWIPYRWDEDSLVIATSEAPSRDTINQARLEFGADVVLMVITTDWDISQAVSRACRESLLYTITDNLALTQPGSSARAGIARWQWAALAGVVGAVLVLLVIDFRMAIIVLMTMANTAFAVSILFKVLAALRWPFRQASIESWKVDVAKERLRRGRPPFFWRERMLESDLPLYTILIPAYHEEAIITKVLDNVAALDYPTSKLEVLVLLEEDDVTTLAAARAARPPEYVRLLVVPAGEPQTKPRACNYGLEFAQGEFIVIYDAEDRPEPDQLRLSVQGFREAEFERRYVNAQADPLICLQAGLNYFNADYNVLTRMFAIEYAFWFDAMLPGLDQSGVPLPLGGTSNHFATRDLRAIGGWDPYNVTEDADLGLRAAAMNRRVSTLPSMTWEEACSRVRPWIRQRTRWTKGYLVTAAVNTRRPLDFWRRTGLMGMIGVIGLILGTPLAFLLYPIALGFTLVTYIGVQFLGLDLPEWVVWTGVVTMIFGNLMMIIASGVAAWTRNGWRVAIFAVFLPVYWLLHSYAAWRSLLQLTVRPFVWEKTPHGLSGNYETAREGGAPLNAESGAIAHPSSDATA